MKKFVLLPLFALTISVLSYAVADAGDFVVNRQAAKRFATMPEDGAFPEGITVNPANGDIYVGTFNGADSKIFLFNKQGKLIAQTGVLGAGILGLAFGPDEMIYYCAIGEPSQIQRIDASLDGSPEVVADVPLIPPNVAAGPNDLTFNIHDDLFFSDSFQGAIFRIEDPANNCPGCLVISVI